MTGSLHLETPTRTFTNKILLCIDCKEEFVFPASAQEYFAERGIPEDPKRCKSCYTEFRSKKLDRRRAAV
jgi:hypothetical protein